MSFASLFPAAATAPQKQAVPMTSWGGLFSGIPTKPNLPAPIAPPIKPQSTSDLLRATIAGLPKASSIPEAAKASLHQAVEGYTAASQPHQTLPQFGENVLKTGAGVANTLFSPLAPLTNQIGKLIQYAGDQLAKTGPIASYGRAVANIPNYPQEDAPTRILNAILNATVIGGAVVGAKGVGPKAPVKLAVHDLSPETTSVGIRRPITVGGTSESTPVNIYHPATPTNELPSIPFGKLFKKSSDLSTIEAGTARTRTARASSPDLLYEPVRTPVAPRAIAEAAPRVEAPVAPERPIIGGQRATKAASDITEALVQKGFDRLPLEEQARYTPTTRAEQFSKVSALMREPVEAESMVRGETPLPHDVQTPVFFNAMEAYAHETGNIQLLRDMAKSPLAEATSKAAQELGSAAFNKNDYGPVAMIRKVQKARTDSRQTARRSEAVVRRARVQIRKANTKESWEAFVHSITC